MVISSQNPVELTAPKEDLGQIQHPTHGILDMLVHGEEGYLIWVSPEPHLLEVPDNMRAAQSSNWHPQFLPVSTIIYMESDSH